MSQQEQSGLSPFELLPSHYEQTKLICMIAARSDIRVWADLYNNTDLADVWEGLALQKTAEFQPPASRSPTTIKPR